jgi:hypothetical protein
MDAADRRRAQGWRGRGLSQMRPVLAQKTICDRRDLDV